MTASGPRRGRASGAGAEVVDDLVYDVGMHRGEDTAYYLAKGYRVVAIEANPELVGECRERFSDAIASGKLTMPRACTGRPHGLPFVNSTAPGHLRASRMTLDS